MKKFSAFYQAYCDKLFAYLMRFTGDYFLSKDIMQEAFARCFERYRDQASPALLFTVARNLLFDNRRRNRNTEALSENHHNAYRDPEHDLLVREEYRAMLGLLQRLEATERDLLALVVSSDLTYREIAGITGLTEGNVKVKVHRARLKLRQLMEADGHERFSDQHVH